MSKTVAQRLKAKIISKKYGKNPKGKPKGPFKKYA